jgi:putative aldouronate transport system substrate-binding protein
MWFGFGGLIREYTQWRDAGLIQEVTEYFWKYPHFREYHMKETPLSMFHAVEPDGRLLKLPGDVGEPGHMIAIVRKDWLDKLGMGIPTTLDEYDAYMRAVKFNNPDGHDPSNVWGLIGAGTEWRALWTLWNWFDADPEEFYVKNGEVVWGPVQPEVRNALEYIQSIYTEGLIEPSVVLRDNGVDEQFTRGMWGSFYRWIAYFNPTNQAVQNMKEIHPGAEIAYMLPLQNPHGTASDRAISPAAWCYFFITDRAENPERIYAFYDSLIEPGMENDWVLRRYGIEGMNFTRDSAGIYTRLTTSDDNLANNWGIGLFNDMGNRKDEWNIPNTPEVAGMFARGTQLVQVALNRNVYLVTSDRPAWNENRADLERLREEYLWGIIAGQRPLSDFEVFIDLVHSTGLPAALEETARLWADQIAQYEFYQANFLR